MTLISDGHVSDQVWDPVAEVIEEEELAQLVFAITSINAWNRLCITARVEPGHYEPGMLAQAARGSMPDAIHTEGLTKRYGETLALDSLDLAVREGEVYGYLGPNGAGKTTTIRLLLGLHRATAGRAELFGIDAWDDPVEAHPRVAYVPGEPLLWPKLTAAETFEFLARLHGSTDVAYRDKLVERFKLDTSKRVRALSKGNRQKVQLVAALATRADLLTSTSRPAASIR